MKGVLAVVVAVALTSGLAAAAPTAGRPTLTYIVVAGVSDSGLPPVGGGICLGNRRVTDPAEDGGVSWSPDGARFTFYRQTGALTADVFVADADGSHLQNLTKGSAQFSWDPDWSPDGSRIVYVASDPDAERLVTIRPDGTGGMAVPATTVDPNRQLGRPRWFPDGSVIGFQLDNGIHVVRPDGSDERLLLANALAFDWAPDGRRIVFTRDNDLALADADGSNVSFLTHTPRLAEGTQTGWSPDGSKLIWDAIDNTDPKVGPGPGDRTVIADGDGRNRRIFHPPAGVPGGPAAWRPPAPMPKGTRPCALEGTDHHDVLIGTPKGDLILAKGGSDVVRGRGGNDVIVGDRPFSKSSGKDRLFGGPGRDFIDAYDGRRDLVDGGSGRDRAVFDRHDRVRSIERYG